MTEPAHQHHPDRRVLVDDQQGSPAKAARLLYWDGNAFVPVANASGLGVAGSQYNAMTFDESGPTASAGD